MLNTIFSETGMTLVQFVIAIAVALVLGILSSLVFKYKSNTTASFTLTLTLLPVVIAVVIMLVNGSIGAGVAVAGAFALVRFRSVPGTAREIAAIFTTVVMGVAVGMGYVFIATITFGVVAVVVLIITSFQSKKSAELVRGKRLKISIPENYNYDNLFDETFEKYTSSVRLDKVSTSAMGTIFNLSYTVCFKTDGIPKAFIDEIRQKNGNLPITVTDIEEVASL